MDRIACLVLFLMMLLTMADVLGRKAFSKSVLGAVELSEFMLVLIVLFALAHTEFKDGHVRVDLVMAQFGEKTRAGVDALTQFVCFVFSVIFTGSGFVYAEKMRAIGEVSQDLWLPKYPFLYVVVAGFAILSLALLARFIGALGKAVRP
jgi:TRAP-type mannitol/chloroaromatic compound transport system permease small subunit